MELVKGRRLNNRFKVIGSLGAGDSGRVFLVQDSALDDSVLALKVLSSDERLGQGQLELLKKRFEELTILNRPNIVHPIEFINDGAFCAVAMECFESEDLSAQIERGGLSEEKILYYLQSILTALEDLHSRNLVHGHLTPANVLIGLRGDVKITALGLDCSFDEDSAGSATLKVGSAYYFPPEFLKLGKMDKRGDFWSFGVICSELVADQGVQFRKSFRTLIARASQVNPEDRYQDIHELKHDFSRAVRKVRRGERDLANLFVALVALIMIVVMCCFYLISLQISPHFNILSLIGR